MATNLLARTLALKLFASVAELATARPRDLVFRLYVVSFGAIGAYVINAGILLAVEGSYFGHTPPPGSED
jgi:hypothetical protein